MWSASCGFRSIPRPSPAGASRWAAVAALLLLALRWGATEAGGGPVIPGASLAGARAVTVQGSVSAGGSHSCGVQTNGALACWGANELGQASPPAGTFTSVSAGDAHGCGIQTAGALACWGANP